MQTFSSSQKSKFVIMGDFNLPNGNWKSNTTSISVDQSLSDLMAQMWLLEQNNRSATHRRANTHDLVFISEPDTFD